MLLGEMTMSSTPVIGFKSPGMVVVVVVVVVVVEFDGSMLPRRVLA